MGIYKNGRRGDFLFFIIGITNGTTELGARACGFFPCCGTSGKSARVTCVFRQFLFFFLPLFRFGKRYFVSCPDCNSVYEIEREEGRRIARDPSAVIRPEALRRVAGRTAKFCPNCGVQVSSSSLYCPSCGTKL